MSLLGSDFDKILMWDYKDYTNMYPRLNVTVILQTSSNRPTAPRYAVPLVSNR